MYIGIIGHSGEDKMNIAHLYGNTLSWILEHPGHETPTLEFILFIFPSPKETYLFEVIFTGFIVNILLPPLLLSVRLTLLLTLSL